MNEVRRKLMPNKKGIFFTLTAVIFLIILIGFIVMEFESNNKIKNLNVEYSKQKAVINYVYDIEDVYLPNIISSSEKFALIGFANYTRTNPQMDKVNFIDNLAFAINTSNLKSGDSLFNQSYSISGLLDESFDVGRIVNITSIKILAINHTDSWNIEILSQIEFTANHKIITVNGIVENSTWSSIINYSNDISLIGLVDPVLNKNITEYWQLNDTKDCFLELLISDYNCDATVDGLCPLGGC